MSAVDPRVSALASKRAFFLDLDGVVWAGPDPLPGAVEAVRRSVLHWRFIDSVAAKIDDAGLRQAQQAKDAVRAYELVYAALGA